MTQWNAQQALEHNAVAHDRVAASYDAKHTEIFNPVEQRRLDATLDELLAKAPPSPDVLDVGAGTGNLTTKFLARGCHVHAADVSALSLDYLKRKAPHGATLRTSLITDEKLPFADRSFDVVATYSVLHHVPDYLLTVSEMARVLRPGGIIYIDHEASESAWRPSTALAEYRAATRLPAWRHALDLLRSGEAFTPAFAKTVAMKLFVNRRYEREGDLHVWPDDHIEWDRVAATLRECGVTILEAREYLHYRPRGGEALYARYEKQCGDMKFIFARKAS
jgi:ubiquinone/menaquinone biosynthesis C-methylase UbiE